MITHQTPDTILHNILIMMLYHSAVQKWQPSIPECIVSSFSRPTLVYTERSGQVEAEEFSLDRQWKHQTEAASLQDEVGEGNKLNENETKKKLNPDTCFRLKYIDGNL